MLESSSFSRFFANYLFFHQHSRIPGCFSRSSEVFLKFLIFKGLKLHCDRCCSLDSSLTGCFFSNIQGSKKYFGSFFFPGLALNLQKQLRDPRDFPKVGVLHSLPQRRVRKSGISVAACRQLLSACGSMDYADSL
jgi:hypothetical protein